MELDVIEIALVRRMLRSGQARALRVGPDSARPLLSLAEAGAFVGVSSTEFSRYERGVVTPRTETALRVGELLARLLEAAL